MAVTSHHASQSPTPLELPQTLLGLIEAQAAQNPHAEAIAAPGRPPLRYAQLFAHTRAVAAQLAALGLGRGDRIALVLPSTAEMATAFLATTAAAVAAPLNPAYLQSEFDFHLTDLAVKAIILPRGEDSPARAVAEIRSIPILELEPTLTEAAGIFTLSGPSAGPAVSPIPTAPDDTALVLHTSGTTARPKIVPLSHKNLCAAAHAMARSLALTSRDRCLNVMPLFHIHGLSTVYASIAVGASVVCPGAFDAARFLSWVEASSPTWTTAAPTIHHAIREIAEISTQILAQHPFRFLRSASSAMPPQTIAALERLFGAPFIEAYGMTEASPIIASNPLPPARRKVGSVGLPAGTEVVILDEAGAPLPPHTQGEVAIRGDNITRGYEGDSAANEAAFVRGYLRTGDRGYLDEEGYLYITGRIKEIINRGGEKISPREVDEALLDHPAVAEAVAFAVPHPRLGEDVAAAVVLRPGAVVTPRELQRFVAERLADFKVPRQVAIVDHIPAGSTAKVQRIGLAEKLGLTQDAKGAAPSATPETPTEEAIAAIWADALGVDRVGRGDDFFRLGGDSILATRVAAQIARALGVSLSGRDLFLAPTVFELARRADELSRAAARPALAPITPLPEGAPEPLSFMQEGFWFIAQIAPKSAAYNVQRTALLTGPLDGAAFARSLTALIARHRALRTIFPATDGLPYRALLPPETVALDRIDLRALPPEERDAKARRFAREQMKRPFDLGKGPLVRAVLVTLDDARHLFVFTAHHIIIDLFSIGIVFRELAILYNAALEGVSPRLSPLRFEHADFAAWQRAQEALFEQELGYWRDVLRGAPHTIALPYDRPLDDGAEPLGKRRYFRIPDERARALEALCRSEGATRFMALLAVFSVLLARISGQHDLLVGTPIAGRSLPELEGIVGLFTNTLVLRVEVEERVTFRDLLRRVREIALGAYAHHLVPFRRLVEVIRPKDRVDMPLVQVGFRVQSDTPRRDIFRDLTLDFWPNEEPMSKFDLAMEIGDEPEGMRGFVEYPLARFDDATIERLVTDFEALLAAFTADPSAPIASIHTSLAPRPRSETAPAPPAPLVPLVPLVNEAAPPKKPKLKSLRDARRKPIEPSPGAGEAGEPPPEAPEADPGKRRENG